MSKVPYALAVLDDLKSDGPLDASCFCKGEAVVRRTDIYGALIDNFPGSVQKGTRILGYKEKEVGPKKAESSDFVVKAYPENKLHIPYSDWPVGRVKVRGNLDINPYIFRFGEKDFLKFIKDQAGKEGLYVRGCGCDSRYIAAKLEKSSFTDRGDYLEAIKTAAENIISFEREVTRLADRIGKQKYKVDLRGRSELSRYKAILEQDTLENYGVN